MAKDAKGEVLTNKQTIEEVQKVILDADAAHVSTLAGPRIRSRMMHFGLGEGFTIYLASMKSDPKTVQISNDQNMTLLFRKVTEDERESAEVEITGLGEIVKDEDERQKGFALEVGKSSVVRGLIESGNTRLLECIKVRPLQVKYRVFKDVVAGVPPTVLEFPQNAMEESDWRLFKRKAKLWAVEVRLPFSTASILPIILGAMIAFVLTDLFDWWLFFLTLIGGVAMHLGTNVFNDYFDHKSMNDEVNREFVRPFSGGSRMIQLGLLTPLEVLSGAIFLFGAAALIGVYLAFVCGWPILALGIAGLVSGYFYTAPPVNLASRGIGELMVGLNFSVLMTIGAYYVQTLSFSWVALVASIPLALLIVAVLYVNEFPDYKADKSVGKRHLVVRMGRERAMLGVPILFAITFGVIITGVAVSLLPVYTLVALLAVPFGVKASRYCARFHSSSFEMVPANAATIMAHMFTGILLICGFGFTKLEAVGTAYVAIGIIVLVALISFLYWSSGKKEAAMANIKKTVA